MEDGFPQICAWKENIMRRHGLHCSPTICRQERNIAKIRIIMRILLISAEGDGRMDIRKEATSWIVLKLTGTAFASL